MHKFALSFGVGQRIASFGTFVAILVFVHAAAADVFVLSNGGRIEGRLLNPDESPRQTSR